MRRDQTFSVSNCGMHADADAAQHARDRDAESLVIHVAVVRAGEADREAVRIAGLRQQAARRLGVEGEGARVDVVRRAGQEGARHGARDPGVAAHHRPPQRVHVDRLVDAPGARGCPSAGCGPARRNRAARRGNGRSRGRWCAAPAPAPPASAASPRGAGCPAAAAPPARRSARRAAPRCASAALRIGWKVTCGQVVLRAVPPAREGHPARSRPRPARAADAEGAGAVGGARRAPSSRCDRLVAAVALFAAAQPLSMM